MSFFKTTTVAFCSAGNKRCLSMYDDEGWGYMGASESYQEGHHNRNSEHDD